MIIGIDASRANNREKTGVEWYAFHVIEEMKKMKDKVEVKVILYSDKPLEGELAKLPANWESKVLRWPPGRLWTQVRLSWEMMVNPPDVLFIPAHVFPIIHPKKTVMTVHDVAAMRFPEIYNWFERWYSLWSARFAAKHLWRVIVPSEFTKQELSKLEIRNLKLDIDRKIIVIPHGYNEIKIKTKIDDGQVLASYGIRKPFLLSIGRLEKKKNTRRIVEAFDVLRKEGRDLQLVLIGKPGYGFAEVKDAIEQSPWKHDIILLGWVEEGDIEAILSRAEVFVFPSLYEGFGIPVLEAFEAGVPVVATTGSSLEEVGGDAALYASVDSTDEIAARIREILTQEQARSDLIQKGTQRAAKFSWKRTADETWAILTETK